MNDIVTKKRYIVGIDPGLQTGVGILNRTSGKLVYFFTSDFVTLPKQLVKMFADRGEAILVVEIPPAFIYERNRVKKRGTAARFKFSEIPTTEDDEELSDEEKARQAINIGANRREAQLLASTLKDCGFYVKEVPPVPVAKWTQEQFELQFKGAAKANQHERDAVRLAFVHR